MHSGRAMFQLSTLITIAALLSLMFSENTTVAVMVVQRINSWEIVWKTLLKQPPVGGVDKPLHLRDYVAEKWLPQKRDNFAADAASEPTWMMRYYVNADFYQPGGPIFIMVGGEWEINPYLLHQGHFYDMAKQQAALMFYTEHRYYGKSWPSSDASTENLKYLNVLQSLEDLRHFIEYQKSSTSYLQDAKVVLVGGSYSGTMVTWFMKLYPGVANVAWASSAPLVAKMDFYEYMNLAMSSIKEKGGARCAQNLELAFKGWHKLLHSSTATELLQRLQVCSNFDANNEMDISALYNALGNYFASVVQGQGSLIIQFCRSFLALDSNPTEALVKYVRQVFLPSTEVAVKRVHEEEYSEEYCLDLSYEGMLSIFSEAQDLYTGTRCWFYQTCHEFGWFPTTTAQQFSSPNFASSPFAGQVSLKFFQNLCQDVFTPRASAEGGVYAAPLTLADLRSRAETINHIFGGLTNVSQRVIFTHGLLDPWRAVGMQRGHNVLLLRDYSHVEDLGSINLKDTVEMNVAKLKVAAFINKALRD